MVCCPSCGQDSPLYFRSKDYNRLVTREIFNHYRCTQCRLIFISPLPLNLSDYYPETYHFAPDAQNHSDGNFSAERFKIEIVQRFIRKGKLLEIGPSYGSFTQLAKKAGFEVEAIEMDAQCCRYLNETIGVRAFNSSDPIKTMLDLEPYDVIALWHVIEHLPDPWLTLDTIYARLKPDGILVLAAPNPDAIQFQILGRYWPHVDAPRHLTLIPVKLLVGKLKALGMTVELITTNDKGSIDWNIFGWEFFFANLSSQFYLKKILRRFGRIVGMLFKPIDVIEGKGSAYTVVARKGAI